mgnify:CR=1 FL=1
MGRAKQRESIRRMGIVVIKLVIAQSRNLTDHDKILYCNILIDMMKEVRNNHIRRLAEHE